MRWTSLTLAIIFSFVGGFVGAYGSVAGAQQCKSGPVVCFIYNGVTIVIGWMVGMILGLFYGLFAIFTVPLTLMKVAADALELGKI
jgi:uncharacterized membrane protein YoaK (UPF0700 family)